MIKTMDSPNGAFREFIKQLARKGFSAYDLEIKSMWDTHRLITNKDGFAWYLKFAREFFKTAQIQIPTLEDPQAESLDLLAYQKLERDPVDKDTLMLIFAHPNEFYNMSYETFTAKKQEYTDNSAVRRYLVAERYLRSWAN